MLFVYLSYVIIKLIRIMKRKFSETDLAVIKKQQYETMVAIKCNSDLYCFSCNDPSLRSITMLILTNEKKISHQFSTYENNNTEKDILEKAVNILKNLNKFRLISYGLSSFDLKKIAKRCDFYNIQYKYLFEHNVLDLQTELCKYIKLDTYKFENVTEKILNKKIDDLKREKTTEEIETLDCELYLELVDTLNMLNI